MTDDEQAFLSAIRAAPEDEAPRLVFADWLDEAGRHEDADRQRKWRASDVWLHEFAELWGFPYEQVMRVAAAHCATGGRGFRDYLTGGAEMEGEQTPAVFWEHFTVVTGLAPDDRGYGKPNFFSCSC